MYVVNDKQKSCPKCFGYGTVLAYKKGADEQPYAFACDCGHHPKTQNFPAWHSGRLKDFDLPKFDRLEIVVDE